MHLTMVVAEVARLWTGVSKGPKSGDLGYRA